MDERVGIRVPGNGEFIPGRGNAPNLNAAIGGGADNAAKGSKLEVMVFAGISPDAMDFKQVVLTVQLHLGAYTKKESR